MGWLTSFLLGRPGLEYSFDVNPAAMQIDEAGVIIMQQNLAGDLKKSVLKTSAPIIRVNSKYLTFTQRNQFNSLVAVQDTFLSFQTRDDWQVYDEAATVLTTTSVQLTNSSATRLSAALVSFGLPSVITILSPWKFISPGGMDFGEGGFGDGGFGSLVETFDPGTITYDDATRIITFTNPLQDANQTVYVSYTYTGWLVNLEKLSSIYTGGLLDIASYDFVLNGA